MPSFSMASASARMPRPDVFSERKSSSMMTIGKRNFMESPAASTPIPGAAKNAKGEFSQIVDRCGGYLATPVAAGIAKGQYCWMISTGRRPVAGASEVEPGHAAQNHADRGDAI